MPRDIERLSTGSNLERERSVNPVGRQAEATRDRINTIAGREIQEANPYPRVETNAQVEPVRQIERENPAKREAQDALQGVLQSVDFLVNSNGEHHQSTFRERIPLIGGIWGMVRSHSVAGKEAVTIGQIREEMAHLRGIVAQGGLNIDLTPLQTEIDKLSPPGGVTKVLGSVFRGIRQMHREWYAPTVENIQIAGRNLQLQLRRSGVRSSVAA